MPPLRLFLYRSPTEPCHPGSTVKVLDCNLPTWQVQGVELNQMDCSFEQAVEQLSQIPRLFIEPDGSFVWTGSLEMDQEPVAAAWQLYGMLYDVRGRLNRVEIQGSCPLDRWQTLCDCLQPDSQLVAYLLEYRCFVMVGDLESLWS
jgi:hypothetical protein